MRVSIGLAAILFCGALFTQPAVASPPGPNTVINRIEGSVWDPNNRPVSDVYVELLNETYSSLARMRTGSSGRFTFHVQNQGNYFVKVFATGTNFEDAMEAVELVNIGPFASDTAYVEIRLRYDKRKMNLEASSLTDEVVFAQEVPDRARELYNTSIKLFAKDDARAIAGLEESLSIFPEYFAALNSLGRYYVQNREYEKSFPYLIKAIDVNQRSFTSFYALAYASYKLNHLTEAAQAARAAVFLQGKSFPAALLHGTVLRLDGRYEDAEKELSRAKKLGTEDLVADVNWQLALLYNRLGRNPEAVAELKAYLRARPDAPNRQEVKDLIKKLDKKPATT